MQFPTPHTVGHAVFDGTGQDSLGNDAEDWADPVDVKVIGYQPSMVESVNGYTSRVVSGVDLFIPPTLAVSVRDRFHLPGVTDPYEVESIEDYNHGFHGWTPGSVLKLKQVTG